MLLTLPRSGCAPNTRTSYCMYVQSSRQTILLLTLRSKFPYSLRSFSHKTVYRWVFCATSRYRENPPQKEPYQVYWERSLAKAPTDPTVHRLLTAQVRCTYSYSTSIYLVAVTRPRVRRCIIQSECEFLTVTAKKK